MSIMLRGPLKIISPQFLPTAILSKTRFRADEVVIERHSASQGLVQPHARFGGFLGGISPAHDACRVSGADIGRKLAVHHGIAHAALACSSRNRPILVG